MEGRGVEGCFRPRLIYHVDMIPMQVPREPRAEDPGLHE